MSRDLAPFEVTSVAVTPGYLRSESMLENWDLTEENWRDAIPRARGWEDSETPFFVGRAVAALETDSNVSEKTGQVFNAGYLALEYGFKDVDGQVPLCYSGGGRFVCGFI
jgi:NAD(P)-dependent dehydrogenase (short-subunit alcohol dehydrogenase family)